MRASLAGESLHSKTENCTRWPYLSQTSAIRLSRDAPTPSVSAMSYVMRMSIPSRQYERGIRWQITAQVAGEQCCLDRR